MTEEVKNLLEKFLASCVNDVFYLKNSTLSYCCNDIATSFKIMIKWYLQVSKERSLK